MADQKLPITYRRVRDLPGNREVLLVTSQRLRQPRRADPGSPPSESHFRIPVTSFIAIGLGSYSLDGLCAQGPTTASGVFPPSIQGSGLQPPGAQGPTILSGASPPSGRESRPPLRSGQVPTIHLPRALLPNAQVPRPRLPNGRRPIWDQELALVPSPSDRESSHGGPNGLAPIRCQAGVWCG